MSAIAHRLRLGLNTRRPYEGPLEVLTNQPPVILHGADATFEIFLAVGDLGVEDTTADDTSNITELNVAVMESQAGGTALMGKGTTSISACTLTDFEDGDPEDCMATVQFSYADTQLLEDGETDETKWLCIYGVRGGGRDVFGCGPIRIFRPGLPSSSQTELTGATARISDGAPQFLDGSDWYSLAVITETTDGGSQSILVVEQTAFAGTYNASAVGLTMATNDGQLWIRDGSDWRPCIGLESAGEFVLALSGSTTSATPNGVLSGTDYRVANGRHEFRRTLNGYWYPIEIASPTEGVRVFQLGPSYSIV